MGMRNQMIAAICGGLLLAACDGEASDAGGASSELDQGDAGAVGNDNATVDQQVADYGTWMECSQVPSDCMEAACVGSALCGIGSSPYDQNMCFRPECASDDDCVSGSACTELEYAPVSCGHEPPGSGDCRCGNLAMARTRAVCLIQPEWEHADCSGVPAECMQAACDLGLCGRGGSPYDENLCLRPACTDDEDCDPGSKCIGQSVPPLACETDSNTGVCDCEIDYASAERDNRAVCIGPS